MNKNTDTFYLNTLLQNTSNNISFVDTEYTYKAISQSYLKTFNKTKEEIIGKKIWDIADQNSFKIIKPHIDNALSGKLVVYETWFEFPNKKRVYMKITYAPIYNADKLIGIVVTANDITEMKLLQMENENQYKLLIEKSKSAKLGDMIAFITHQMRQPLNTISTSLIKMDALIQEKNYESLHELIDLNEYVIEYLNKTLNSISEYQNLNGNFEDINMCYLVDSAMLLLEHRLHTNNIHIEVKCDKELTVQTIKSELIHILIILINNAIDSLILSGNERRITFMIYESNLEKHIDIYDNGKGVDSNIFPSLFEPGNTNKSETGHGYGLYFAKKILDSSLNGTLTYHLNSIGHYFRICLARKI